MFAKIKLALAVTAVVASPATGRESCALDLAGKYAHCREDVKRAFPKGGDRARDFMMSSCINDGRPGSFYSF
jgi:hypothetical protein